MICYTFSNLFSSILTSEEMTKVKHEAFFSNNITSQYTECRFRLEDTIWIYKIVSRNEPRIPFG